MALNKLENQIKEKLNSRDIQPSAKAWDRLDAMLTVAEQKKTKRSFGWLYLAASVLVLLTVGMFLFNQKSTGTERQDEVVGTEVQNDSIQKEENNFQAPINKIEENKENQIAEKNFNQKSGIKNQVAVNQFQSSPEAQPNHLERSGKNQKQSNPNPLINREKQIEFQNSSDVATKDLPKIKSADDIYIKVDNSQKVFVKKESNYNSDDFLLAGLDKTANQSVDKKSTFKVDAKSLLSQVDGELELTFRQKVINKISKNYKEVKVALANRNQE